MCLFKTGGGGINTPERAYVFLPRKARGNEGRNARWVKPVVICNV